MSTSLRQISPQIASIRGRMVNPRWHTSEAASIVMPHAAASRAFTLFLLAVFRHAGPIRVDLDIAPGVFDVLSSPDIALVNGFLPRRVHGRSGVGQLDEHRRAKQDAQGESGNERLHGIIFPC